MKYFISIIVFLSLFNSCGPSGDLTVSELRNDKAFNPGDFVKSKISIYTPYVLNYPKQKYPSIEAWDLDSVVLSEVKEKLSDLSDNQSIIIENKKAPDYFRSIKNVKLEGNELLSNTSSDYLVIIHYVLIGTEMEVRKAMEDLKIDTPIGEIDLSGDDQLKQKIISNSVMDEKFKVKNTTKTAICYDIWDVKRGVSVYTSEASIVLPDGINHKNPYRSIEKVTEAFINKIISE